MTYYIKFENGPEHHSLTQRFDEIPSESGWFHVGDSINGKHWKLENEIPVEMTKIEFEEYQRSLSLKSAIESIRIYRNILIKESDWTQSIADNPLSPAMQQAWAEYRQALRDFPETVSDPLNPEWPVPPA